MYTFKIIQNEATLNGLWDFLRSHGTDLLLLVYGTSKVTQNFNGPGGTLIYSLCLPC